MIREVRTEPLPLQAQVPRKIQVTQQLSIQAKTIMLLMFSIVAEFSHCLYSTCTYNTYFSAFVCIRTTKLIKV